MSMGADFSRQVHTLSHMKTPLHVFILCHSNFLPKVSYKLTSASATPTHSRVFGGHVAEHCTACFYVNEDISSHAHPLTSPPHWQAAKSEESSMKNLQTKWGSLPQKLRVGWWLVGKGEGGNSSEKRGVSEVWFCIQRWDLLFNHSAVISLTEAFSKSLPHPVPCRLQCNKVWWLIEGDTCLLPNIGQLQIPNWLRKFENFITGQCKVTWRHYTALYLLPWTFHIL